MQWYCIPISARIRGEGIIARVPTTPAIDIRPFQPADQAAVKALVLAGLADHWEVLDPALNPDLNDIATTYANATFLVAQQGERIVACGALVPRGNGTAEIVRMSVSRDLRRHGIGRWILAALVEQARSLGFRRIVLETTETWQEVIAFYLRFGFHITHHAGGDVYFALEIDPPSL
jgi:putative acetyltransferase